MKRKLTVDEESRQTRDYRQLRPVPRVRLRGRWLQAAGFAPGASIDVSVISPGVIELRLCGPVRLTASDFQVMGRLDKAIADADARKGGGK